MSAAQQQRVVRRWCFSVLDFNDHEYYLAPDGSQLTYEDAVQALWTGTDSEAVQEANRRANCWEAANDTGAIKVIYHSYGIVDPALAEGRER